MHESISLKHQPSSEPLHISAEYLFLNWKLWCSFSTDRSSLLPWERDTIQSLHMSEIHRKLMIIMMVQFQHGSKSPAALGARGTLGGQACAGGPAAGGGRGRARSEGGECPPFSCTPAVRKVGPAPILFVARRFRNRSYLAEYIY